MKNSISFVLLGLCLCSCQDFLTVEHKGRTTIPVFLSYPNGLQAGLTGAYNKTYAYQDGHMIKYGDVAGNMLYMSTTSSATEMVSQYNYTSNAEEETGAVGYIWRNGYEALSNVNNVIQYQPSVLEEYPQDADLLNHILGQAYALRALCHFDLCRTYGQAYCYTDDASHLGIPVLTKTPGPNDNPSRNTVAEAYKLILSDLNKAEELLSDFSLNDTGTDIYHFNLEAVQVFLSRVYLYKQDWQKAFDYASQVAQHHSLAYGADYLSMFNSFTTSGEALLRLSGEDQNGKLKSFYDQTALPADTLISLFDAADIRLKLLYRDGQKYVTKYYVPNATESKRNDLFLFRTSEAYLTAAEAACQLHDYDTARLFLKQILARAVDDDYAQNILASVADTDLLELTLIERVKELCFEGHCMFDLTRRGASLVREVKTSSTMPRVEWPSDRFVLPIPLTELNANHNIKQ